MSNAPNLLADLTKPDHLSEGRAKRGNETKRKPRGPDQRPRARRRIRDAKGQLIQQGPPTQRTRPDPHLHPRAYSSMGRPIIRWTVEHQARAVSEGWFLERDIFTNYVRLIALPSFCPPGAAQSAEQRNEACNAPRSEDKSALRAWAHLEQQTFRHSVFHGLAIAFIEQQTKHQFSDAWDQSVQRYSPRLRWYKQRSEREREQARVLRGTS